MNKKIELIEFDGKFWEKVEFRPPNAGEVFLCDICKRVHSTEFCWISVKVWILREVSAPPQPPASEPEWQDVKTARKFAELAGHDWEDLPESVKTRLASRAADMRKVFAEAGTDIDKPAAE